MHLLYILLFASLTLLELCQNCIAWSVCFSSSLLSRFNTTQYLQVSRAQIVGYPQCFATMSATMKLLCWVIGTHTKQTFAVRVGHDNIWDSVKVAIKEKKKPEFDDIAEDTLDLWKVRHCAISAQLLIHKVTIGRSQRRLLGSEDCLKSVTATVRFHRTSVNIDQT
jgi:hypothetical protein